MTRWHIFAPVNTTSKGNPTEGFVADEWEEASAYTVVMCRAKGVVDYMVLAGSGLLFFGLVWTALLHIVGSAQDPQRQSQESMASVFRILVGYTILIMCYLVSSVFFHSSNHSVLTILTVRDKSALERNLH